MREFTPNESKIMRLFYTTAYKNSDRSPDNKLTDDMLLSGIKMLYAHENHSGFSSTLLKLTQSQRQEIYDLLEKHAPDITFGSADRKKKLIKPKSKRKVVKKCKCK
jgi:hypothetical protein